MININSLKVELEFQNESLICVQCEKKFKTKKSLTDHLRIHSGEKPFLCLKCQRRFTQFSSFQKHERIHSGEQPYLCEYKDCKDKFSQISNLKRHNLVHLKIKPYQCSICNKKFRTQSNLKQHTPLHEESKRQTFQCEKEDNCQKIYQYSSSLKKHIKETHKQEESQDQESQIQDKQQTEADSHRALGVCIKSFLKSVQEDFFTKQTSGPFWHNSFDIFEDIDFQKLAQDPQAAITMLKKFFTCRHPKVIHDNHVDILFNGYLYFYNEDSGKIVSHELNQQEFDCHPVSDRNHQNKQEYESIECCEANGKKKCNGQCCQELCCLACNGGACQKKQEEQINHTSDSHIHGPTCGHPFIHHLNHQDYLVNGVLHFPHEDHCDNHGFLQQIESQQ